MWLPWNILPKLSPALRWSFDSWLPDSWEPGTIITVRGHRTVEDQLHFSQDCRVVDLPEKEGRLKNGCTNSATSNRHPPLRKMLYAFAGGGLK
jgi:hypothetical protein